MSPITLLTGGEGWMEICLPYYNSHDIRQFTLAPDYFLNMESNHNWEGPLPPHLGIMGLPSITTNNPQGRFVRRSPGGAVVGWEVLWDWKPGAGVQVQDHPGRLRTSRTLALGPALKTEKRAGTLL